MTALRAIANRVAHAAKRVRMTTLALAGLLVAAAVAVATVGLSGQAPAASVTAPIPPARAAALLQATTGSAAEEMQAVGEQAKVINAALPFSTGPNHAALPFSVGGAPSEQQRALLCLTQAVYYEAGFEPLDGRRAVAQVVLNRLRHPAFPKSICGVVYQGAGSGVCQFTFVCDGALYRAPAMSAWREAELVARAALAGFVDRGVGEATHYHADYVAPRWAPLLAKVASIGQHIFYRWPGAWGQPAAFTGRYIGEPRDPLSLRPPLRLASAATTSGEMPSSVVAGPPVPRAASDVGGLLDTSKGWTLHIPGPEDSGNAAAVILAEQQGRALAAKVAAADGGAPLVGSR